MTEPKIAQTNEGIANEITNREFGARYPLEPAWGYKQIRDGLVFSIKEALDVKDAKLTSIVAEWKKEEDLWIEREKGYRDKIAALEADLAEIREQVKGASLRPDITGVSIIDDIKDMQRDCNRLTAENAALKEEVALKAEAYRAMIEELISIASGAGCELHQCGIWAKKALALAERAEGK